MPPISDWQLGQTHGAVVPPSCVSRDEFPTKKKNRKEKMIFINCGTVCESRATSIARKFYGKIPGHKN
jgi:hypothetical protein